MEITPQDLGEIWRRRLLKRRAITRVRNAVNAPASADTGESKPKRGKRMRRFWLRPANLPTADHDYVESTLTKQATGAYFWRGARGGLAVAGVIFLAMLALSIVSHDGNSDTYGMIACGSPILWMLLAGIYTVTTAPRRALRRINTDAVTSDEVESLLATARGELDRSYLNTVLETIRQPIPTSAGQDIRAALRAVGDSISAQPGEPLAEGADNSAALRQQAQEKRQAADAQADSLIAESLRRQAESDERQAYIAEQSGSAAKRARARYAETQSQIAVLRSVLTVYASPETAARMEQGAILGDTVRRVAAEASATAQAKRELENEELAILYGKPLPEPAVQAVGINPAPTVPNAPTTNWWRNNGGNGGMV